MTSTTDSLAALRSAIKAKSSITYVTGSEQTQSLSAASHLVLSPSVSLLKSSPTRFRRPGSSSSDPSTKPEDFYSTEAIYIAWLLRDASGAEYMKQARESGLAVGFVSVTERKSVVDWLEGRTSSHPNIVPLTC
jgi:parafibromin